MYNITPTRTFVKYRCPRSFLRMFWVQIIISNIPIPTDKINFVYSLAWAQEAAVARPKVAVPVAVNGQ